MKQAARAGRESELAAKQLALPTGEYGVIYADPPWRFEVYSEDTGQGRAAEAHYPTMAPEAIAGLADQLYRRRRLCPVPVGERPRQCRKRSAS